MGTFVLVALAFFAPELGLPPHRPVRIFFDTVPRIRIDEKKIQREARRQLSWPHPPAPPMSARLNTKLTELLGIVSLSPPSLSLDDPLAACCVVIMRC